jgi:hypothetical protein
VAPVSRLRRAGNVDGYLLDMMGQVERIEGRMRKTRRQVEELVADAAHGHITLERMRQLGSGLAQEQLGAESELSAAKARLLAQQSEAEQRRYLAELRDRVAGAWDGFEFSELQNALRELLDRIEVDGAEVRVFTRL